MAGGCIAGTRRSEDRPTDGNCLVTMVSSPIGRKAHWGLTMSLGLDFLDPVQTQRLLHRTNQGQMFLGVLRFMVKDTTLWCKHLPDEIGDELQKVLGT